MLVTLSTENLEVETALRVPLSAAITLPVLVDGVERGGLVVYVGVSGFAETTADSKLLTAIAERIVTKVNG